MRQDIFKIAVCCLVVVSLMAGSLRAAISTEQKKEIKEILGDLAKIGSLVSKKKYTEAATAIQAAEDRIAGFVESAKLKEADPLLKPLHMQLEKVKGLLNKANGKGGTSFAKTVAPILASKCVSCHSEQGKGGLNLETFEGLEKGGQSGALIEPGNPDESLLISRLITEDEQQRMPKGKDALNEKDVRAIAAWIAEGAKFDGDKTEAMSMLAKNAANSKQNGPARKTEIVKATGKETVHFMQDIMPELMDTCGRCHNDTVKRSGFSVMSFEKLMRGGDSGAVIVAGSLEQSRLWRLVNGDDTPVMPAGNQTGITRKWYDNLKTWITEGAKFDGADPKKNFPTLDDREKAAIAKFTPEQWVARRKKNSEAEWKKTFPNVEPKQRESSELILYGDVSEDRLEQIEKWAGEHIGSLRQTFKIKDDPLWRGKLAVFVFKERFGYEEFNNSVHRREVPREILGHSQVSGSMEDAFIAMQDVGDSASDTSPGMQVNLIEQLTGAYLKRGGGSLPDWLIRGAGLSLAHRKSAGNPYLATMPKLASSILQESKLTGPGKIFDNGSFAPGEVGPIGFTMVEFLLKRGDLLQFGQFIQKLHSGTPPEAAAAAAYHMDADRLAVAYSESLPIGMKKGKK